MTSEEMQAALAEIEASAKVLGFGAKAYAHIQIYTDRFAAGLTWGREVGDWRYGHGQTPEVAIAALRGELAKIGDPRAARAAKLRAELAEIEGVG